MMQWIDREGVTYDLHHACYEGRLDVVTAMLELGADPDEPAPEGWWITSVKHARPLHCVAIAWTYRPEHPEIIRLLVARGAVIDETVRRDYWFETTLTDEAIAVGIALGLDEPELREAQQRCGAVHDRYAGGKVLFVT